MINGFNKIRQKSEDWLKGQSKPNTPMSSGETARKTSSMMGNLTPAEQQLINTETAKGSIRNSPSKPVGMYQKQGFTDMLPGGLEGAQQRVTEGRASLNDLLATGNRQSRYGGYGQVREEVQDTRMIQGPYGGRAAEDATRMRSRDVTEQEYLDQFNEPNRKMFEESNARLQAMKDLEATRAHETGIADIEANNNLLIAREKNEAEIEAAQIRAESNVEMTRNNMVGKDADPRLKIIDKDLEKLYSDRAEAMQFENNTALLESYDARIKLRMKEYNKIAGLTPVDDPAGGGQGGGAGGIPTPQTQADFDALPAGAQYIDPDDGKTYTK